MNKWVPPPSKKQITASRKTRRISYYLGVFWLVGTLCIFFVDGWPEWLGYLSAAAGFTSWMLFVRSTQELHPPGNGPFGRED